MLELAAPAWTAGLNKRQVAQIERVQKTMCSVLLGAEYKGYENALAVLDLQPLSERRVELSLTFARKVKRSHKYSKWFIPSKCDIDRANTRSDKIALKPVKTRTMRYRKSPLPFLTKLLNDNWKQTWSDWKTT